MPNPLFKIELFKIGLGTRWEEHTLHLWYIPRMAVSVRDLWLRPTDTGSSQLKQRKEFLEGSGLAQKRKLKGEH